MNYQATRPVSVTLKVHEWCLVVSIMSAIIESTIELQDDKIRDQTRTIAHIRETIDKATD